MSLPLPATFDHACWGPSEVELAHGIIDPSPKFGPPIEDGGELSDSESHVDGEEGQDEDVWQMIESLEVGEVDETWEGDAAVLEMDGEQQQSPRKRARLLDD
jgi:hypothetical protein